MAHILKSVQSIQAGTKSLSGIRNPSVFQSSNLRNFYYGSRLNPQASRIYWELFRSQTQFPGDHTVVFPITDPQTAEADCSRAYQRLVDDHPELFHLAPEFSYRLDGRTGSLFVRSLYTPEEIENYRCHLKREIRGLLEGTEGLKDFSRECLIYGRMAERYRYLNTDSPMDHSCLGPVINGYAVCEGLTALLLMALRAAKLPCMKVCGRTIGSEELHCWAMIFIGGKPVYSDLTADLKRGGLVRYEFFNLTDWQLRRTHRDYRTADLPLCTETDLSYYFAKGCCFRSPEILENFLKKKAAEHSDAPVYFQAEFIDSPEQMQQIFKKVMPREFRKWTVKYNLDTKVFTLLEKDQEEEPEP